MAGRDSEKTKKRSVVKDGKGNAVKTGTGGVATSNNYSKNAPKSSTRPKAATKKTTKKVVKKTTKKTTKASTSKNTRPKAKPTTAKKATNSKPQAGRVGVDRLAGNEGEFLDRFNFTKIIAR